MSTIHRRRLLQGGALGLAAWSIGGGRGHPEGAPGGTAGHVATPGRRPGGQPSGGAAAPSERVRIGCVGVGGRAASLMQTFAGLKEAEVVAVCDVDTRRIPEAVEAVRRLQAPRGLGAPRVESDFRRMLDDQSIDALCIGTPDHWHAIPAIMACQAGKDVYVEKPDGHNIVEGQRMVQAMRRHGRIVQLGTQSRTGERCATAMEYLRSGKLGKCRFAKAWESARQGSIGRPPDGEPPSGVDYDTWLGPAPKRPFNVRRFHGHWRWFFDYGTGDLGNDGVHRLDVALWGLNSAAEASGAPRAPQGPGGPPTPLGLPTAISASGGKWYFDDMQEWPDTLQVTYEFPEHVLTYEMRIWAPYSYYGLSEGAAIYGDQGYMVIGSNGWKVYGPDQNVVAEKSAGDSTREHIQNFLECVKSRKKPNADLETVGHPASLLCHAGNIAWRTGRKLRLDPKTESFHDREADALRTRPRYRKPWVLPEV